MANFLVSVPPPTALFSPCGWCGLRSRRVSRSVSTRAGPSANSLALTFLLPLSLVGATIFVAVRVADKLDEDYYEDLQLSQTLEEAGVGDEEEMEGDGISKPLEDERTRNRPKRPADNSSLL